MTIHQLQTILGRTLCLNLKGEVIGLSLAEADYLDSLTEDAARQLTYIKTRERLSVERISAGLDE